MNYKFFRLMANDLIPVIFLSLTINKFINNTMPIEHFEAFRDA